MNCFKSCSDILDSDSLDLGSAVSLGYYVSLSLNINLI